MGITYRFAFVFTLTFMQLIPTSASAQTAYSGANITFLTTGCQMGTSNCYFKPSANPNACRFDVVYINISTSVGRAIYSSILAAQILRKPADITYTKNSDTTCSMQSGNAITFK